MSIKGTDEYSNLFCSFCGKSQDEVKKLSAGQPYYWRVRAVDAASNESAWSAVRDFTISGPMLPAWVVYVLIGIGGLLLLILGMVLGRRNAHHKEMSG